MAERASLISGGRSGLVVMSVIQPGPFHNEKLRQEVRNVIHRTLTKMRQLFQATTRTWQTRVEWDEVESTAGGIAYASVTTGDPLYYLINKGSPEHEIVAINYPTLVWRKPYESKTEPRVLDSRNSFRGNQFGRKIEMTHPGFEAREFDEAVREQVEDQFEEDCQEALDIFARKSGHSMSKAGDNSKKVRVQPKSTASTVASVAAGAALGSALGGGAT